MRLPSKQSRRRETILTYRAAFERTDEGRQVLHWLLERCGLFEQIQTEEQRIMHNWGITLLDNMGMTQGFNYDRLIDALLSMTIPDEAIDKP